MSYTEICCLELPARHSTAPAPFLAAVLLNRVAGKPSFNSGALASVYLGVSFLSISITVVVQFSILTFVVIFKIGVLGPALIGIEYAASLEIPLGDHR